MILFCVNTRQQLKIKKEISMKKILMCLSIILTAAVTHAHANKVIAKTLVQALME